jgi:hypothetical protein
VCRKGDVDNNADTLGPAEERAAYRKRGLRELNEIGMVIRRPPRRRAGAISRWPMTAPCA